ncbi:DUF6372 family protein [Streptomyces sp. AMCC400023]|uniref:DUF6372 family protein n=1 Tax=Streptomyces sp. AMCC400023 TaxID=2056258 RepID=UPI001F316D90|nr:DUF6372 family protein [Streptomyces sp. AMCC400023]UJV47313.1 hypothetical protein CVT30_46820 [Streptomyces sp. AMCC400023]UJV47345.1 hypothetical protein CVT30_46985 [Streptomyces sp. AMCC400023]
MTAFETDSPPPILTVDLPAMYEWEPDQPGGCRCACAVFHQSKMVAACTSPGQPGLLIRVQTPDQTSRPLPVCIGCYNELAHPQPEPYSRTNPPW